jgi:hypothetical protein
VVNVVLQLAEAKRARAEQKKQLKELANKADGASLEKKLQASKIAIQLLKRERKALAAKLLSSANNGHGVRRQKNRSVKIEAS